MRAPGRKQDDIGPFHGETAGTRSLAQHPLAPVSKDGVSKPFRSDEGDLVQATFVAVIHKHGHAHELVVVAPTTREDLLKFRSGFDGLHTIA